MTRPRSTSNTQWLSSLSIETKALLVAIGALLVLVAVLGLFIFN